MFRSLVLALASFTLSTFGLAQQAGDTVGAPAQANRGGRAVADNGAWIQVGAGNPGSPDLQGSLTTIFAADNAFRGNMFDISPAVTLSIEGIDINTDGAAGTAVTVDVWYRPGTSFGFEGSSAGWILFASGGGTSNGLDQPTYIDLAGNGVCFQAGQTYGIYVDLTSYTLSSTLRYTNGGPTVYANSELTITTNAGKGDPAFTGGTFFPRQWNGRIWYDVKPGKRVAIAAAAAAALADCRYTDVRSKLLATGRFSAVDILDVITQTPTLNTFKQYDAVLTWSNTDYFDAVALGNTLADYVDAGGGVVVAVFANTTATATRRLGGRWITDGYEVIIGGSGQTTGAATLGSILAPDHAMAEGVFSFDGGTSSFRPTVTALNSGATTIATWNDGRVLAAAGQIDGRADLGFYPPSSDCAAGFWNSATDGDVLMANALCYVAAPKLSVAIVAGDNTSANLNDVKAKLASTGKFKRIDTINTAAATPTLAQLLQYDSVICWTNSTRVDSVAWGNVMADYVDAGGGVVVAVFANSTTTAGRRLEGRWLTGNYEVLISASGNKTGAATLGAVLEPDHPIMAGVSSFNGGASSYRANGTALTPGSKTIARWSDGSMLVSVGCNRRRADLGFFPPSSDAGAGWWVSTTDGALLMANALCYVARPQLSVALVAAALTDPRNCRFLDVQSKLNLQGGFKRVDIVNVSSSGAVPTLEQLKRYDAVLTWSNVAWINATAVGDVLADYVDAGGGVVSAVFANASIPLAGRWVKGGYEVIVPLGQASGAPLTLGAILQPGHPLLQGVTSFDGGTSSFRSTSVTLTPGSTEVARWSNGSFLVVAGRQARRADLNFYPPSSDCTGTWWNSSTHGALLMANALRYVAGASPSGAASTVYCVAKEGLFCGLPSIGSQGLPSASATSGFVVTGSPARANRLGVLLYTNAGRAAVPFVSGGHILCIGFPPLRRGGPVDSGGVATCDGVFSLDMNEFASGNYNPPFPTHVPAAFLSVIGTMVNCQWWGRDTMATGSYMSNGLEYCIAP